MTKINRLDPVRPTSNEKKLILRSPTGEEGGSYGQIGGAGGIDQGMFGTSPYGA